MPASILVVEDEALIAADIRRTLQRLGYEVWAPVATGQQALAAARVQRPDLVLMDIQIRGALDGIETARLMRAEHAVPVVYLSSHSDDATLARAMETQPYGYLLKPFEDRELRTSIEVALHKHHLEMELARRARWFETTLGSLADAVISTDAGAVVSFMNPPAEQLTGHTRADAIGRPLDEIVQLVGVSGERLAIPVHLVGREPTLELPRSAALVQRDLGRRQVEVSACRIVDDGGTLLGTTLVLRDVTTREALEQRVAQVQRLASVGALASGLGHELNTPLAGVIANVDLARDALGTALQTAARLGLPPELASLLQLALEALEDATLSGTVVRSVLDKLRRLVQQQMAAATLVAPAAAIEEALARLDGDARRGVTITCALAPAPLVAIDNDGLVQVLGHLLSNAIQAIAAGPRATGAITVSAFTDPAGRAVIEVADDGIGMVPELLRRVFDPFVTTRDVGAGTGLGLALAHTLITRFGGEMTAVSTPGEGAVFRIALPPARIAHQTQPIAAQDPCRAVTPASGRARVLVIDDDEVIRKSLRRVLGGQHDVEAAHDGASAHDLLQTETYDVVLCDLMMPGMSGVELFEAISRERPAMAARFVFITGGATSDRTSQFLESTRNRYLLKPFGADAIREIVQAALADADLGVSAGSPAHSS